MVGPLSATASTEPASHGRLHQAGEPPLWILQQADERMRFVRNGGNMNGTLHV
jgi:hypothetical protein